MTAGGAELRIRVLSGVAVAAPSLAAIYAGGIWLAAIASLAAGVLAWEWRRLTEPDPIRFDWAFVACCALAPWAGHFYGWPGACSAAALAAVCGWAGRGTSPLVWSAAGAVVAALAPSAMLLLRALPDGLAIVLWLAAVVVASDVGAYAVGRAVGGPRLAPRISPGKTWSGAVGGLLSAGAAGAIIGGQLSQLPPAPLVALSLAGGVVAQAGDLCASRLKRRAGVKDSGRLIPGHGGAIDRFDALVAVVLAVALFRWGSGIAVAGG